MHKRLARHRRNSVGECPRPSATIALMAKFRPARAKKKDVPVPQGAIPCVILCILAIAAVMLLLFLVMKGSSSS